MRDSLHIGHPTAKPADYIPKSGIPFKSDLARLLLSKKAPLDTNGVSADVIGDYDGKVLGVCGEGDGSSSLITTPNFIDSFYGQDWQFTGYIYFNSVATDQYIFSAGNGGTRKLTFAQVASSRLSFRYSDSVAAIDKSISSTVNTSSNTLYYFDIRWDETTQSLSMSLNSVAQTYISALIGLFYGSNAAIFYQSFAGTAFVNAKLHSFKFYFADVLTRYYPDMFWGYEVVSSQHGTPSNVNKAHAFGQLHIHKYGFELYRHNTDAVTYPDIYVPYMLDGSKITPVIANYTKISDHPPVVVGNAYGLNCSGQIDFAVERLAELGADIHGANGGNYEDGTINSNAAYGTNLLAVDAANVHRGGYSLKSTYVDSNQGFYRYFRASTGFKSDLTVSQLYYYSAWVSVITANALGLFIYDGTDNHILAIPEKDGTWCRVELYFTANSATGVFRKLNNMGAGDVLYLDDEILQPVLSTPLTEPVNKAFQVPHKLATVGNGLSLPEYFIPEITHKADFDPAWPYRWNDETLIQDIMCYGVEEVRMSIYAALGTGDVGKLISSIKNLGIYTTQKTIAEMDKVASKGGWESFWNVLTNLHFHSDTYFAMDLSRGNTVFLDTNNKTSKILDWSGQRDHVVQAVSADRYLMKKIATDSYIEKDADVQIMNGTPVSVALNEDFRIVVDKLYSNPASGRMLGANTSNYVRQYSVDSRVRLSGTGLSFLDINSVATGQDVKLVFERMNNLITAKAIKPDGTVIVSATTFNNGVAGDIFENIGFVGATFESKIRKIVIQKTAQGALHTISDQILKDL